MALATISIKRHNHRIHPCIAARKQELLKHLIEVHQGQSILVISDTNTGTSEFKDQNLTLSFDEGLKDLGNRKWDVLISFEVPLDANLYLNRLNYAKTLALILVDESEQTALYPIETLLGRTIVPEIVKGFEPPVPIKEREFTQTREPRQPKPFDKTSKEKRHTSFDRKSSNGEKKPWDKNKNSAAKRVWDKDKKVGEKRPWDKNKKDTQARPWDKPDESAASKKPTAKRTPRTFTVKSLKPTKED